MPDGEKVKNSFQMVYYLLWIIILTLGLLSFLIFGEVFDFLPW